MIRVVLDTHIWLSALLLGGPPEDVVTLLQAGEAEAFISPAMLDELAGVLQRKKFNLSAAEVDVLVRGVAESATLVHPAASVAVVKEDDTDNRILEGAVAAGAAFVISGDAHLLKLGKFGRTIVLKPADFLRQHRRNG